MMSKENTCLTYGEETGDLKEVLKDPESHSKSLGECAKGKMSLEFITVEHLSVNPIRSRTTYSPFTERPTAASDSFSSLIKLTFTPYFQVHLYLTNKLCKHILSIQKLHEIFTLLSICGSSLRCFKW